MIDLDNQTDLPIDLDSLEKIASYLSSREVELIIVDNETMKSLNLEHRNIDSSTDVLSFPLETPFTEQSIFDIPLGSVIISDSHVRDKSKRFSHTIQDELSLLFIHGVLHLLGFDHETDAGEMRDREASIIRAFDLPKSLIIRTGE